MRDSEEHFELEEQIYALWQKVCEPDETERRPSAIDAIKAIRERIEGGEND